MILALMVVGSLAVVALLTFAVTLFSNRPPIEVRDRTFWTAKSAMAMAMTLQREYGAAGCYRGTDSIPLNGFNANITCSTVSSYGTARGRLALVTTGNDPAAKPISGLGAGAVVKPITGEVFVNGGLFDSTTTDIGPLGPVSTSGFSSALTAAARYGDGTTSPPPAAPLAVACSDPNVDAQMQFPNPGTDWAVNPCSPAAWWTVVGDRETPTGPFSYPELPPLPSYLRPNAAQAIIGSCSIYYPGRYDQPLTLGAGDHYFPSGVYYIDQPLTLQPGARLVAGEGRYAGCSFDAEAGFEASAPKFHEITGKGATLLLGGDARIVSTNASVRINRRVSTPNTRGTETVAIRSVNFATAAPPATPQAVEIPDDVVYVADVYDPDNASCDAALSTGICLERGQDHTVQAKTGDVVYSYTPSTLTPADDIIVVDQTSGGLSSNQFVAEGYVFVPNARVQAQAGSNASYRLRITGGLVTSGVDFDYTQAPPAAADWFVGVVNEPIQAQVQMTAVVTAPNGQKTVSKATLEVNVDRSYAINGWTVDPNAAGPVVTLPPDPDPTTTTTTAPPETTTTLPPETTTTTTTTTTTIPTPTTTLPPVIPPTPTDGNGVANCDISSDPKGWNRDFGPGNWAAEFWNNGTPSTPFPGAADVTQSVARIDMCGSSSPVPGQVDAETFTARFTKTFTLVAPQRVTFLAGGDDGYRLFVGGTQVVNNWGDHSHEWKTATVDLPAGDHVIRFEYYENGGNNTYQLWKS